MEEGAFVVEGAALVAAAHDHGWEVEALFLAAGTVPEALPLPSALTASDVSVFELGPGVMERVASTETAPAVVATVRTQTSALDSLAAATFVLVGDRINDPGNAGTMLRSAEAAGADAVVLTEGSVDVFNPKVVRASAGALFSVPVVVGVTLDDALQALRVDGLRSFGTTSHAEHSNASAYFAADLARPCSIVVGNEAHGLPADARVDAWITIPHAGRAESLNVAMAATVIAFEVARQRGAAAGTL